MRHRRGVVATGFPVSLVLPYLTVNGLAPVSSCECCRTVHTERAPGRTSMVLPVDPRYRVTHQPRHAHICGNPNNVHAQSFGHQGERASSAEGRPVRRRAQYQTVVVQRCAVAGFASLDAQLKLAAEGGAAKSSLLRSLWPTLRHELPTHLGERTGPRGLVLVLRLFFSGTQRRARHSELPRAQCSRTALVSDRGCRLALPR